jgi:hypothetical protein
VARRFDTNHNPRMTQSEPKGTSMTSRTAALPIGALGGLAIRDLNERHECIDASKLESRDDHPTLLHPMTASLLSALVQGGSHWGFGSYICASVHDLICSPSPTR